MHILHESFLQTYGNDYADLHYARSPLRICPLGAHVDHQHGLVTGMALDAAVKMLYVPDDRGYVRLRSLDFPDEEYFHLDHVPGMVPGFWGNYLRGAILSLRRDHILKKGFKAIISGNLPIGGLSSSAAVTTAYLIALCDVNGISATAHNLMRYSHWVENSFIGLNNGLLDQAANILSKKSHLLFMDMGTNHYELLEEPSSMPSYEIIVVYSGISKALISTDYNNRVDECKVSAWILQELAHREIASLRETYLRDVGQEMYEKYRGQLPERFRKRADHFFAENARVLKGVEAWKKGDLKTFGQLMSASGESSIHLYECGCPELITIYDILREAPGVYGARFSGAGYRGCCIGLIDPTQKDRIKETIDRKYPAKHPAYKDKYRVHFCQTDDGARIERDV
ncbi:MAG: galactokinase family protein [Bacteroidota bacterium]